MILDAAKNSTICFDDIKISASENKIMQLSVNGKFSRIKSFIASKHSGIVERVSEFLYQNNKDFRRKYDDLLNEAFCGIGIYQNLYAVKTKTKHKITNITKIEKTPDTHITTSSQINKFLSRYGKKRR